MKNNNHEDIQSEIEKKASQRKKKKKLNMKMSGKQVKNLQKIIIENKSKNPK